MSPSPTEVLPVVDRVGRGAVTGLVAGQGEGDSQRGRAEVVRAVVVLVRAPARTGRDQVEGAEGAAPLVPGSPAVDGGVEAGVRAAHFPVLRPYPTRLPLQPDGAAQDQVR